jgi:CRP/FNR family transcriptional regulator, cyclic AMP receptor protein
MGTVRDDVVPALQRLPLFAGFDRKELTKLAERFDEQSFLPEHGVLTEGMQGMEFFIILDGNAEVIHDGAVIATLKPGDFFGEVAVLDGGPRTASVRALDRLRTLGLPNGSFKQLLLDYPLMAVNLLPQVIRRFRAVMTTAQGTSA